MNILNLGSSFKTENQILKNQTELQTYTLRHNISKNFLFCIGMNMKIPKLEPPKPRFILQSETMFIPRLVFMAKIMGKMSLEIQMLAENNLNCHGSSQKTTTLVC